MFYGSVPANLSRAIPDLKHRLESGPPFDGMIVMLGDGCIQ
jgi:hypothetical protein